MLREVLTHSLVALSAIFVVVDPLAAIPFFLAMTSDQSPEQRRETARRGGKTVIVVDDFASHLPDTVIEAVDGQEAIEKFGMFKDRSSTGYLYNATGNPPVTYTPILYYGNLETFSQSAGALGPSNLSSSAYGYKALPTTMNFSLALQRQIGTTTVDASYVGSLGRHLAQGININAIPMYARFDPKNQDPTQTASPLPDNFLRPYRGYGNINSRENIGSSNYHSLQITANRRFTRGLQMGAAFTWSKVLSVSDGDGGGLSPYFPARSRNYGPTGYDQPHALVFNYIYDLPKIGTRDYARDVQLIDEQEQVPRPVPSKALECQEMKTGSSHASFSQAQYFGMALTVEEPQVPDGHPMKLAW